MTSTRARLTVSYAFVLLGTMVIFATAVWAARRNVGTERLGQELGPVAFRLADQVLSAIQTAQLEGKRLTYIDSTDKEHPAIRSTRELAEVLDPIGGYYMVLDQKDRILYPSVQLRLLSADDQTSVLQYVLQLPNEGLGAAVPVRGDSVALLAVVKRNVAVGPNISRVVAAMPSTMTEVPAQLLVGTMVVLAPIIFVVSLLVAYLVVGNAFRPIDKLINEVEAITDGRSLHRRLATDASVSRAAIRTAATRPTIESTQVIPAPASRPMMFVQNQWKARCPMDRNRPSVTSRARDSCCSGSSGWRSRAMARMRWWWCTTGRILGSALQRLA